MTSLIPQTEAWPLLAIIVVGVAFCIYLEQTFKWAAKLSGPVLALIVAMIFSNSRIVPTEAPIYDVVDNFLVPVAVPLLLFQANLRRVWRETGPMFLTFHIASMGSILGAFAAAWMFPNLRWIEEVVGIMTGSYVGGGVNFVAIAQTYQVPSNLTNPLIVADNFIMAGFFVVLLIMAGSRLFRRWYPHPHSVDGVVEDSTALAAQYWRRKEIALKDIAQALAIAIAVVALSKWLSGMIKAQTTSKLVASLFGSPYVLITFFTAGCATYFPKVMERIHGAEELGFYLLYLFFFVIGLRADLFSVIKNMPELFVICLVMAVANLAFTLIVGRLFKLNLEELLLSVNATLGGAPSAAAMAISTGWTKLVLPGVLSAIWGYVIGTFVGILVAEAIRSLLH